MRCTLAASSLALLACGFACGGSQPRPECNTTVDETRLALIVREVVAEEMDRQRQERMRASSCDEMAPGESYDEYNERCLADRLRALGYAGDEDHPAP